MKKQLLSGILFLFASLAHAQELNCNVTVLTPQIQSSDKKIYTTLQTAIYEFMNNTRWTDDQFTNQERIECSIQINISERISNDEFKGTIQVQSRRPVYKTSYYSPLLNINDENFQFRYIEFQTIEFNESGSNSSLSAILAFYAYLIIGVDYDTFSPLGGSPFLQRTQTIVANQQNSPERGWRAFESDRNRYWLAENLNNPVFKPLRELLYNYHRKGLDIMSDQKDESITAIAGSIEGLRALHSDKPGSFLMQTFLFAKADEIINIFSGAYPDVKVKMVNALNEFDPANGTRYQTIMNKN
ncbi:MAG: DUF4835 family protein [Bacteroidota bacterium]|nr:DUF4835 family protein [Flavisolibacter sp.]MDQ3049364.1 DUF4835 family protein [Bacteroidota bacterium]